MQENGVCHVNSQTVEYSTRFRLPEIVLVPYIASLAISPFSLDENTDAQDNVITSNLTLNLYYAIESHE